MTKEDIEAEQIAEQSVTRARIRVYVDEIEFALEATAVLSGAPEWFAEFVPEMVPLWNRLFASPLVALATTHAT